MEQHETPVPGWSRLRNQGASAGFALGGGAAIAGVAVPIMTVSAMARPFGPRARSLATAHTPCIVETAPLRAPPPSRRQLKRAGANGAISIVGRRPATR